MAKLTRVELAEQVTRWKLHRDEIKPALINIRVEYENAQRELDRVGAKYMSIKNKYDRLDRKIAEHESFKVIPAGRSGIKKKTKKIEVPPDPVALFKSMSPEQKKEFLASMGIG